MKFKVTHHNIAIDVPDSEVEDVVLAATATLVPVFTKKLYFCGEGERTYEALETAAASNGNLVILDRRHNLKTLINKVRIVHQGGELFIVPQLHGSLAVKKWKEICRQIESAIET